MIRLLLLLLGYRPLMVFSPFGATIGNVTPPLPVAQGGTGATTAQAGLTALGALSKVATDAGGTAGVAKINGTQTVCSWTVPNDGQRHRFFAIMTQDCTVAETGGAMQLAYTMPDGHGNTRVPFAGGAGVGVSNQINGDVVQPGSNVTFSQTSALTAGTTVNWCEIWGL